MKIVIGLVGVKTSGKSTAANIIKNILGENVIESALADKLKKASSEVFGVPRWAFDSQLLKERQFIFPRTLGRNEIESVLSMFGITPTDELMSRYSKVTGMELNSPRQIAQIVGTEILRNAGDEDIHCKNVNLSDKITIISDIRFPNEFSYFKNLSNAYFLPFYIQRDEAENKITPDSHSSETSVFMFRDKCIKINNNDGLQDLEKQIKSHLRCTGLEFKGHNL
jgi:hypothetical protein